jgi:hypothetical protein
MGDPLLASAYTQSYNVTQPFNAFNLFLKAEGFIFDFKDDKVAEKGGKTNFYALGKTNARCCLPQDMVRKILAQACEESVGTSFFAQNQRMPLLRLADYGVPTAHLKTCYHKDSIHRARVSLDLDCSANGAEKPFPTASAIFKTTCEFLQEWTEPIDDVVFANEPCSVFLGSNASKNRSCHIIFHDLCFDNVSSNILGKKHILSKKFNVPLDGLGFESDFSVCSSGLRFEFTDKWDVKQKSWRGCSNPLAETFNTNVGDLWWWEDMWDCIDPLVIPKDRAWKRAVVWKQLEAPKPAKRTKAAPKQVVQYVSVEPVLPEEDTIEKRIGRAVPEFANVSYRRVDLGEGRKKLMPLSNYCPFKSEPSSDHPAHEHSCSKIYIFEKEDGSAVIHCGVCQGKSMAVAGAWFDDAREKAIIAKFNSTHAIMQQNALQLPIINPDGSRTEVQKLSFDAFMKATMTNNFKIRTGAGLVSENQFWWGHPAANRFPKGFIFDPSGTHPSGYYNKWLGFDPKMLQVAESMKLLTDDELQEEWKYTRHLIRTNICNQDDVLIQQFIGFFRDMILHPERKPKWAVTLWGPQGIGKGMTMQFFLAIAGKHGIQTDGCALIKTFNGELMESVLLFLDEGMGAFNKQAAAKVKAFITEQSQQANFKFQTPYTCNNVSRVVVASNHKPDYIEEGDRRWLVIEGGFRDEMFSQNIAKIALETDTLRGPAAFYLLTQRHGNFDSFNFARCIRTSSRWDVMYSGFDTYDLFVYHKFCLAEDDFISETPMVLAGKFSCFNNDCKTFTDAMPKAAVWLAFVEFNDGEAPRGTTEGVLWKHLCKYMKKSEFREQSLSRYSGYKSVLLPGKDVWKNAFLKLHGLDVEVFGLWKK